MSDTYATRADSRKAPNSQPLCRLSTLETLTLVRNMVDTNASCTGQWQGTPFASLYVRL